MEEKIKAILDSKGTNAYKTTTIMKLMEFYQEQKTGKLLYDINKEKSKGAGCEKI